MPLAPQINTETVQIQLSFKMLAIFFMLYFETNIIILFFRPTLKHTRIIHVNKRKSFATLPFATFKKDLYKTKQNKNLYFVYKFSIYIRWIYSSLYKYLNIYLRYCPTNAVNILLK